MSDKPLSLAKNTLFNSLGSFFYLGCQWLITVLVVHLGSVEMAGDLSLAMATTNMFFSVATFGIRDFLISDYKNKYSGTVYISTRLWTSVLSFFACTAFIFVQQKYSMYQMLCISLYMVFRIMEALVDVYQAFQQKYQRMDYVAVSFFMRGGLLLLSFSVAIYATGSLLFAFGVMALSSLCVIVFFDVRKTKKLVRYQIRFEGKKSFELLKECVPLMVNSFLLAAIVAIPRTTLGTVMGNYYLGIYSSVATPAVIIQSAAMWLYTPTLPGFAEAYMKRDRAAYRKTLRTIMTLICIAIAVAVLGTVLFSKPFLMLMFGKEIAEHSDLMISVIGTTILIALSYFISSLLVVSRKMKSIMVANIVAFCVALFGSEMSINRLGMDGTNLILYVAFGIDIFIMLGVLAFDLRQNFRGLSQRE